MADFRSAATNEAGGTNITVNVPAGAADGDVLLVYLTSDDPTAVITPDQGGWTTGPAPVAAGDVMSASFSRTISGSPPASYSFDAGAVTIQLGSMVCINAEGGTNPVIDSAGDASLGGAGASLSTPAGIGNVSDPRVFVEFWGHDQVGVVSVAPADMTEAHSILDPDPTQVAYYEVNPDDAGDISKTLTWTVADGKTTVGFLVSFTPAGAQPDVLPFMQMNRFG